MRFETFALLSLSTLVGCGASVRAQNGDGGGSRPDGSLPDASSPTDARPPLFDVPTPPPVDVVLPPIDVPPGADVPNPPDVMIAGEARGEWRLTTFRFDLMGAPAQLNDTNRTLPGDPINRYRVNGTLDIRDDRLAFAWAVLRNDHAMISDPSVSIDEGYSATAFYWNGRLDSANRRFVTGAIGLDYAFETPDILRLSSEREGWVALFRRELRTALPAMTMRFEGQALQISAGTSDPFVRARAGLLWDLPGGSQTIESSSADLSFGGGGVQATYTLELPGPATSSSGPVPFAALTTVNGVRVAWAHLVVYDDVDRSGRYTPGSDVIRGVSPLGIAVRLDGTPDPMFDFTPFRLLKQGWQFVNVERNSEPRPAVLIPYAMTNPMRPDVPINDTPVRTRILDLLP